MSPAPPALPKGIPNCLKKRQLLNDQISPDLCREYGQKFLELGGGKMPWSSLRKGAWRRILDKLKAYSLETGDAFMLWRLGHQEPEDWRKVGERALALGKLYFAKRAFEFAGDDEKTAMVAGLIAGQTPPEDR